MQSVASQCTFKIDRVHPLIMVNMSASLKTIEAHNWYSPFQGQIMMGALTLGCTDDVHRGVFPLKRVEIISYLH